MAIAGRTDDTGSFDGRWIGECSREGSGRAATRRQSCKRNTETVLATSFAKTRCSPGYLSCPSIPAFAGWEEPVLLLLLLATSPSDETRGS